MDCNVDGDTDVLTDGDVLDGRVDDEGTARSQPQASGHAIDMLYSHT